MRWALFALALLGCGKPSEEEIYRKQTECDDLAASIRKAAAERGLETFGVCRSTDERARDLREACARLVTCNAELDAMKNE